MAGGVPRHLAVEHAVDWDEITAILEDAFRTSRRRRSSPNSTRRPSDPVPAARRLVGDLATSRPPDRYKATARSAVSAAPSFGTRAAAARGCDLQGFVEERRPASLSSHRDARPFAKATPVRRERFGLTGVDQVGHGLFVELDDEIAGAVIAAREEVAVQAQARKAHHRRAGHAGLLEERFGQRPKPVLASRAFALVHDSPISCADGTRSPASGSAPGSRSSATAARRAR